MSCSFEVPRTFQKALEQPLCLVLLWGAGLGDTKAFTRPGACQREGWCLGPSTWGLTHVAVEVLSTRKWQGLWCESGSGIAEAQGTTEHPEGVWEKGPLVGSLAIMKALPFQGPRG